VGVAEVHAQEHAEPRAIDRPPTSLQLAVRTVHISYKVSMDRCGGFTTYLSLSRHSTLPVYDSGFAAF